MSPFGKWIAMGLCLAAAGLAGCRASIPYYKTLNSMAVDPAAIAKAERFSVRPVNFEGVDRPGSWPTKAHFLEEMRAEVAEEDTTNPTREPFTPVMTTCSMSGGSPSIRKDRLSRI